jgi:cyclopropane fatty-acyl-phospholipid synthase-like methyltransferase
MEEGGIFMQTATQAPSQLDNPGLSQSMMQMITGYWVSSSIYTVAKLGIADILTAGPLGVDKIARKTRTNEDFLYRLLRALSSIGIFEELDGKTFQLTDMAQLLRSDVPNSMRAIAIMMGEEHYQAWGRLKESVETGKLPFEMVYGMGVFEYFEKNPEVGETFNDAMTNLTRTMHSAIISYYDFSPFRKIVDVGGGHGTLLSMILKEYPQLSGVLFDLPHVASGAAPTMQASGVADRCQIVSGDFFQAVTPGGDAYVMSHIIHDWSDKAALAILRNVHQAMNDDGRLLVVECVIEPSNTSSLGKFMDLNMLVMTPGGRERTEEEFRTLLDAAGFTLNRVIPTNCEHCIIEGLKK